MADDNELEALVIRLVGEMDEFKSDLEEVNEKLKETQEILHETEEAHHEMGAEAVAAGELVAMAVEHMVESLGELKNEAIEAFSEYQDTTVGLSAAIKANGEDVGSLTQKYGEFAEEQEKVSVVSRKSTLALLKQAEIYQVTGEKAEKAARDAIGLAAASGRISAEGAIRFTAAFEKTGSTRGLDRMIPLLRGVKDPMDRARIAAKFFADGIAQANVLANTFSGQTKQLHNAFEELYEEIGSVVAGPLTELKRAMKESVQLATEFVKKYKVEVTEGLKKVTEFIVEGSKKIGEFVESIVKWWESLGSGTRSTIELILGLVAGIGPLITVFGLLSSVVSFVAGIFTVAFSPIGAIIAVAVVAVYELVDSMGGVKEAFNSIVESGENFWQSIRPILTELRDITVEVFGIIYTVALKTFNQVRSIVVSAWNAIVRNTTIAWPQVRDAILNALLVAEYEITHWQDIFELATLGAQFAIEKFSNDFLYYFRTKLPLAIVWFSDNISSILGKVFNWIAEGFKGLTEFMIKNWAGILKFIASGGLLRDGIDWSPITKGFKAEFDKFPVFAERALSKTEKAIGIKIVGLAGKVAGGLTNFMEEKRKLLELPEEAMREAKDAGKAAEPFDEALEHMAGKAGKANEKIKELDSTLAGSSEALERIDAYFEALEGGGGGKEEKKEPPKPSEGRPEGFGAATSQDEDVPQRMIIEQKPHKMGSQPGVGESQLHNDLILMHLKELVILARASNKKKPLEGIQGGAGL